jgi:hypothetical protein
MFLKERSNMKQTDVDSFWYQPDLDVFLNRWFSSYADARKSLENEGGFLLPYKGQFFVCEAEVIRAMGLEADDPDWERVGWDCAQPLDMQAYERLHEKRVEAIREALSR